MKGTKTGVLLGLFFGCAVLQGCMVGKTTYFYEGSLTGKPVSQPVTVVRDEQGVPHIYAQDAGDLFFGLGYVMAQDRLFQMDLYRYVAQGRLCEWFGNRSLSKGMRLVQFDMFMKCFEIQEHTVAALERMPRERRILLERFTEGINQLIQDQDRRPPREYRFLRIKPEIWTVADVMSIPEVFGVGLAAIGMGTEVLYYAMEHTVGEDLTKDFFKRFTGMDPAATQGKDRGPQTSGLYPDRQMHCSRHSKHSPVAGSAAFPGESAFQDNNLLGFASLLRIGVPQGSNNWVVSGKRSRSGMPILANDPHVPLGFAPSFWYHAHLEGDGFSVAGLLYPGYPAFGAGWNGSTAWGVTNIMADQMDLVREMIDPETPEKYLTPDGWRKFESRQVHCKVRWGRDKTFVLRKGQHGFFLPREVVKSGLSKKYPWFLDPASVRYVKTDPAAYFEGQILLMKARNGERVIDALKKIGLGPTAYNYVWASDQGNVGYQAAGRIPVRADQQGYMPREGWKHDAEWRGTIPFSELPSMENPADGIFQSANEKIVPKDYHWYISTDYARPYRSLRIRELLLEEDPCSAERFMKIQADVYNLAAPKVLEPLFEVLRAEKKSQRLERLELRALDVLETWNVETSSDSAGAALFELFYQQLLVNTFSDDMGKDLSGPLLTTNFIAAKVMDGLLKDPDNFWFDRKGTPGLEGRDAIFLESFRDAVEICRKKMGKDPGTWSWGEIHTLYLGHPFGLIPLLGRPYRIATLGYPGDNDTVNGGYFSVNKNDYKVFAGAASRFIVDFGQPDGAWFNCSTGMAGEPSSEYFKNLSEDWYHNRYFRTLRAENPEDLPGGKKLVFTP